MNKKDFYQLSIITFLALAAFVDFPLFLTLVIVFCIMTFFIMPTFDFSEEDTRLIANMDTDISKYNETLLKVMTIIVMGSMLVCFLHKPILYIMSNE
jgi:hypothetical protein